MVTTETSVERWQRPTRGETSMNAQQAWEYRVETIGSAWKNTTDEEIETILNQWGEQGWEVISVRPPTNSNKLTVVAKRPLTENTRRRRNRRQSEW